MIYDTNANLQLCLLYNEIVQILFDCSNFCTKDRFRPNDYYYTRCDLNRRDERFLLMAELFPKAKFICKICVRLDLAT